MNQKEQARERPESKADKPATTLREMMKPTTLHTGLLCLLSASLISGCGGTRENDPIAVTEESLDTALTNAVDERIIVAAGNFASAADLLSDDIDTLCSNPDARALRNAQDQWRDTYDSWYSLLPYNFGPLTDDLVFPPYTFIDSLRLRGTEYSATVRSTIADWVAGEQTLNDDFFERQSFQFVGLLALEVALFEDTDGTSATSAELDDEPRKCQVLQGLASRLQDSADHVYDGWTDDYAGTGTPFRTLFLNAELDDGTEPLSKLLTTVQENLDYLTNRNVITTATPVADQTWEAALVLVQEVEALLEGTTDAIPSGMVSFFSLMAEAGYESDVEAVRSNIAMAYDAIDDQDVSAFNAAIAALDGNFKREIPDGLAVDLGINFTDGD